MIKPLHGRIIVDAEKVPEMKGKLFIPDMAREKPQEGVVVGVGPGKMLDNGQIIPLTVNVGDRILFGRYAGTEVKIDDKEYLLMEEEDVFGVI